MKQTSFLIVLALIFAAVIIVDQKFSSAAKPSDFGLKEGDLISAIFSDDPDVYIINEHGYKRLFLNPEIFKFYKHLGGFTNVKLVTPEVRDSFPTSGLFRNCEDNDEKVYGVDVEGEDKGELRWINTPGEQAIKDDPDFFKKVFCINKKEFEWYPKTTAILHSVKEVPQYDRPIFTEERTSTSEKFETKAKLKGVGQAVICHYPPGNITAFQTLTVGASALRAHLDHGDTVGACSSSLPTPSPAFTITPTPAVSVPFVPIASSSNLFTPNPSPLVTITPTPAATPTPSTTTPTLPGPSPISSASFTPTPSPTPTSSSTPQSPASVFIYSGIGKSGTGQISVSWSASASRYNIYLSVNNGAYSFWATSQVEPSFDYFNVSWGNTYRFKIYGCNSDSVTCAATGTESNALTYSGSSTPTPTPTPTPTSTVTPTPTPTPNPPQGFTTQLQNGTNVWMYWYAVSGATTYKVERFSNGSPAWVTLAEVGGISTNYTDVGVAPGTHYYHVKACNSSGCSNISNEISITVSSTAPSSFVPTDKKSLAGFPRNLTMGSTGSDVKQLQALLASEVGYPAHLLTGYFGSITREAVKKLQEKYKIQPASGYFGGITRRVLRATISR